MKLLLDEMVPVAVAEQLRARGHDVVALTERTELRGASDEAVLRIGRSEGRAIVTENIGDFRSEAAAMLNDGEAHEGLILSSSRTFPRGNPRTVGRLVSALDRMLADPPTGESWERWRH